jgi:hypothetical protein
MTQMDSMLTHLNPDLTVAEAAQGLREQCQNLLGPSVYEMAFRLVEQTLGEPSEDSIQTAVIWTGKQIWLISPLAFIWLATRLVHPQAGYAAELAEIHHCPVGLFLTEAQEIALALQQLRETMARDKQRLEETAGSQSISPIALSVVNGQ